MSAPIINVGVDSRGRLIYQEENLEPIVIKPLADLFLQNLSSITSFRFTLPSGATDQEVVFAPAITSARALVIFTAADITFKVNSIGSSPIPCNPYAIMLGDNCGITNLYLTNLGTPVDVMVWVGA